LENQSLKRRIEPVDIANAAVFLCSEQAALITGQDIHVDGGW
jgi:NAD(P)-dependent dehydrogenase (short-subunit alcohol dehydrogenase family)